MRLLYATVTVTIDLVKCSTTRLFECYRIFEFSIQNYTKTTQHKQTISFLYIKEYSNLVNIQQRTVAAETVESKTKFC